MSLYIKLQDAHDLCLSNIFVYTFKLSITIAHYFSVHILKVVSAGVRVNQVCGELCNKINCYFIIKLMPIWVWLNCFLFPICAACSTFLISVQQHRSLIKVIQSNLKYLFTVVFRWILFYLIVCARLFRHTQRTHTLFSDESP